MHLTGHSLAQQHLAVKQGHLLSMFLEPNGSIIQASSICRISRAVLPPARFMLEMSFSRGDGTSYGISSPEAQGILSGLAEQYPL